MKLAHEADAQQKKSPLHLRNMRLGAAYNLFDGLELLEQSIRSISSQVRVRSRNLQISCSRHPLTLHWSSAVLCLLLARGSEFSASHSFLCLFCDKLPRETTQVDFVVVVFHKQGISGLPSPGTLISTLQRLCKLGSHLSMCLFCGEAMFCVRP